MFGLQSKKSNRVNVRRAMTRIMNQSFDLLGMVDEHDQDFADRREDTRNARILSAFVFPIDGEPFASGTAMHTVTIVDISSYGLGIVFPEPVQRSHEFGLLIGDEETRQLFRGRAVRVEHMGLGAVRVGFELISLLKHHEYTAILQYAEAMEAHADATVALS